MALTLEDCQKVLEKCTNSTNTIIKYTISPLSETPMGFLGDHYKLQIIYQDKLGEERCEKFFLKTVPCRNENHTEYILQLGVFQKEALLYKNLLGEFQKYHKQNIFPRSYLVNPDKFIVLEDLTSKGYANQKSELDIQEWKSVMRTMAKFHASSIIYEEFKSRPGRPYRLNEYHSAELKEATFANEDGHPRKKWAENASKSVSDSMKLLTGYQNLGLEEKFRKFACEDIYSYTKPSKKYRNVVTHADLWKNNIMFKKSPMQGCKSMFVDYQLVRYVPGAFDLLTTLYVNASATFLEEHMAGLLDLYYETFSDSLEHNGVDVVTILPREDFDESVKEYALPGLTEAALFATIIFISDDLSNQMLSDEAVFNDFTFVDRRKYVFREFTENSRFRDRYSNIVKMLMDHLKYY